MCIPVANTRVFAAPAGADRAAEHEVACLEERDVGVDELGRAVDGDGFARQRRGVDFERAREETCIRGDLVAFGDLEYVAGNEVAGFDRSAGAVAHHRGALR